MEAGYGYDSANEHRMRRYPEPSTTSSSPLTLPLHPQLRHSRSVINVAEAQNDSSVLQSANGSKLRVIDTQNPLPIGYRDDAVPSPASLTPDAGYNMRRVKSSSALSAATATPTHGGFQAGPSHEDIASGWGKEKDSSKWKAALGEAQYFAGGLISHPSESNRHFSIIRHSHALVWYRGPSTCVSITILAKDPLPAQRSLWLQQKGFSGDTGMAIKALTGSTGSWLDVTPERRAAGPHVLPEVEERGIQRDLKRFANKASGRQKTHLPRETHVVRIPAAATDGYFRLVVCAGPSKADKVLCGSPVFRVASTSLDASVVRGASLSTMPLEVGVKFASTIGHAVVDKYTGIAQTVVKSQAGKLVANATAKNAVVGRMVHDAYQRTATGGGQVWKRKGGGGGGGVSDSSAREMGPDSGPEAPFPIEFDGRVTRGTGKSIAELGIPTANISGVSETIKMTMGGVFAAWARLHQTQTQTQTPAKNASPQDLSTEWHEAIVTIAPLRNAPPEIAMKNGIAMHIIHDFGGIHAQFYDAKVEVLLMGYLHAAAPPSANADELVVDLSRDVASTLAALGREAWAPELVLGQLKSLREGKTFSERVDDITGRLYEQVDRIPLHWAGVRTESGVMQDKAYGNGGIWIPR